MEIYFIAICLVILVFAALGNMNPHILPARHHMTGGSLNMPVGKDVTLYYAPWCGHCKDLMPEWVKVEHTLKTHPNVRVNTINSEENPHLVKQEGIKGFPTIILQTRGVKRQYKGYRTAKDILSFVLN